MKILVTGGAGFIGSALAYKLSDLGHEVTIVDMTCKSVDTSKVEAVGGDLSDNGQDNPLFGSKLALYQFDYIYHCAAQSSGYIGLIDSGKDIDWNVKATVNVFKYAKQTNVKKVIYTSSMSVYGNGTNLSESSPIDPTSHYGISKYTGELYCKQYEKLGVDYSIFRLFNVYGFGQDMENLNQGMVSIYLAQSLKGREILVKGSTDRFRDFVYIDDVVSALLLGMDDVTSNKTYNVCTGIKTTVKELLDIIVNAHDKGDDYFKINVVDQYEGDQHGASGLNVKLRQLGWEPNTELRDGVKKFIQGFK